MKASALKRVLKKAVGAMVAADVYGWFGVRVTNKIAYRYEDFIAVPMDLGQIKDRLKSGHYTELAAFIADIKLMERNAHVYNGSQDPVAKMATAVRAAGSDTLAAEEDTLVSIAVSNRLDDLERGGTVVVNEDVVAAAEAAAADSIGSLLKRASTAPEPCAPADIGPLPDSLIQAAAAVVALEQEQKTAAKKKKAAPKKKRGAPAKAWKPNAGVRALDKVGLACK